MTIRHRGSALISALFIMTLIAIAVTAMSSRIYLDIYRTRSMLMSDKLYLASQAVTFWAMDRLTQSKQPFKSLQAQGKLEDYPKKLQHIYPEIVIQGQLFDLQARFNLNNLQQQDYQVLFYGLLGNVAKLSETKRRDIILATTHWIGHYQPDRGQDKLLNRYTHRNPPHYPGYQLLKNVSEFRMIDGVDEKLYQALVPFITALPEVTPININTAPKILLSTLGNGLNKSQVNELWQKRKEQYIQNITEIEPLLQKLNVLNSSLTTESQYFLCIASASTPELEIKVYSVLKRGKDKQGKLTIQLLNESINIP